MRPAAVLGALAAERALAIGVHAQPVDVPGNHVELAGEIGHPEAVDHVGALQHELDRAAGRDAHFVRGGELDPARGIEVVHAPPPLMGDDFDPQVDGFARIRTTERASESEYTKQREQHDAGKRDAAIDDELVGREHRRGARAAPTTRMP